jgi:hypothetical protein
MISTGEIDVEENVAEDISDVVRTVMAAIKLLCVEALVDTGVVETIGVIGRTEVDAVAEVTPDDTRIEVGSDSELVGSGISV